jgi:hypothetical protein
MPIDDALDDISPTDYSEIIDICEAACNCDYYELTKEEQSELSVDRGKNSISIRTHELLLKRKAYNTKTGHALGCRLDIEFCTNYVGDFYTNVDTWSARTLIVPRSYGLLKEGPVDESALTDGQKKVMEYASHSMNTRLIGLYRT